MITAQQALERLQEGNQRFVAGAGRVETFAGPDRREALADGQAPFAVILGCSDSRVPAELVFDQGLGDLFVIRVAGHVAAPAEIGSIEFAVNAFGTPLVVVLGHSRCGAILATLDALAQPGQVPSPALQSLVDYVRPAVESLLATDVSHDRDTLVQAAVRANVDACVDRLRRESDVLASRIGNDTLRVIGAHYSLDTGVVECFDAIPEH